MGNVLLFFSVGAPEIIVLLVLVLLLFGGKKIPELMRGLGRGIREFQDARKHITDELQEGMKDTDKGSSSTEKTG
jgi:sec-independent protein translocase protein TatA